MSRPLQPAAARRRPLVAALLLVGAVLSAACSSASTDAAAPGTDAPATSTSPGTRPPTTAGTAPAGDAAALEAEVARLSAFVEQERGLQFLEPVPVHLADGPEFEDLLFATVTEEDWAEMETDGVILEALGLLEPGTDLREVTTDMLGAGVLGFYDTDRNELVVRGAEIDLLTRSTLVHELVHALDDQHFELYRPELDEATDESGFGFSALVEGNARRIELAWQDTLTPDERRERDRAEIDLSMSQLDRLLGVPPILLELLTSPYTLGEPFVSEITETGGQSALDAMFDALPVSSEQIVHPEAYLAGEVPRPVPTPAAEGEVVDEGVIGEYVTNLVLGDLLGGATSRAAAAGWGGDAYVAWRDADGTACAAIIWTMDTPADGAELLAALDAWADETVAVATVTPVDDSTVSLRSCASRPPRPTERPT